MLSAKGQRQNQWVVVTGNRQQPWRQKGIHGCLGQGVTANSPGVSWGWGSVEKPLYTHHHAAQLHKYMEDGTICFKQ